MSQASYTFTTTKTARLALALKKEWTRKHFSLIVAELHVAPAATTHHADKMSAPEFGMWARAWSNGKVTMHPAYEAIRVIKVPGIRTRRLVEHQYR